MYIFNHFFSGKKYNSMHFAFQSVLSYIFSRKPEKNEGFSGKFR